MTSKMPPDPPPPPPNPTARRPLAPDWRLSALVVAFGVLVLAEAVLRALSGAGSDGSPGLLLGAVLALCGVGLLLRAPATLACVALCFLTAGAMMLRLHRTGQLVPAMPIGVMAVALGYALFAERRRLLGLSRSAPRAASAPRPEPPRRAQEDDRAP